MRYVIALDTAMQLVRDRLPIAPGHVLLAPTLLRSQLLSALYRETREQLCDRKAAAARLDHMRALRIRLLGDRVLQKTAWEIADQLGWDDTLAAEYLALTRLQADAFVTLDPDFAAEIAGVVPVAPFEALVR